jgi:hypothetical protein
MRIEKTVEGFTLITELVTAKEMYLYDCATHQHSEYDTDISEFAEKNKISIFYPKYTVIGNSVIGVMVFYNNKTTKEDVVKIQKYIEKKMRE